MEHDGFLSTNISDYFQQQEKSIFFPQSRPIGANSLENDPKTVIWCQNVRKTFRK